MKRGDRIVIDDPHGTASSEQLLEWRRRFLAEVASVIAARPPAAPVIVMARLHRPDGAP